jgi:preprotein translocase subunit YajC
VIEILLAATSSSKSNGNPVFTLIFFGAIFGAMYFLLLRPQRRRVKEGQVLQSSIVVDDEIIMTSGIYGFVTAIEGDVLWVDIADGHDKERIEVRVARSAVARKAPVDVAPEAK